MHLLIGIFSKFHAALLWLMLCFADWPMGVEAKLQRAFKYLLKHQNNQGLRDRGQLAPFWNPT